MVNYTMYSTLGLIRLCEFSIYFGEYRLNYECFTRYYRVLVKILRINWDFKFLYEYTQPISINPEISLLIKDDPAATNQFEIAGYAHSISTCQADL